MSSPRARRASGTSRPLISLLAVPGHQPSALAVAATLEPRSFASDEGGNNRKPNHEAAPAHQSCPSRPGNCSPRVPRVDHTGSLGVSLLQHPDRHRRPALSLFGARSISGREAIRRRRYEHRTWLGMTPAPGGRGAPDRRGGRPRAPAEGTRREEQGRAQPTTPSVGLKLIGSHDGRLPVEPSAGVSDTPI